MNYLTDRGPNVKFDNDDVINRLNCLCHILNNIVRYMCAIEPVKKIIDDTSTLVTYVRNSGLGVKCDPQLKKYVDSRWNTVFDMLSSVNQNYVKLAQILLEKEEADKRADVMGKLTIIPRTALEDMAEFLKKFKYLTKQLEHETIPTLWMVWPTVLQVEKHLADKFDDSDIIKEMKAVGREYMEKNRFDIAPKMVHKISTVLHPLLKNIAMIENEERNRIYDAINDRIRKYGTDPTPNVEDQTATRVNVNQTILDDFMGACSFGASSQSNDDRIKELQDYLNAKILPMDPYEFDLVGWWFSNRNAYPKLFQYFISIAGISASSSSSERKFSETGIILTAHRASLLPDTVSDLVLARNKFLNFL